MDPSRWYAGLVLVIAACGERSAIPQLDALPPSASDVAEIGRGEERGPRSDVRGDGGLRCDGPPRAILDGIPLSVVSVTGRLELSASCCDAGEAIRFKLADAAGVQSELTFQLLRFPGTPPATSLDLAAPPKGWLPSVRCEPHTACGVVYVRSDNSELSGRVTIEPASAIPRETVSFCLSSTPKPGVSPTAKALELGASGVVVSLACVPGMDQTCNPSPAISALYGSCLEDGTCSCNAGHSLDPTSGKCH